MGAPLLLASNSPRRRDLLAAAGFRFEVASPSIEERHDQDLSLVELTTWNATRKGLGAARANPNRVILAADTLVAFEGEIIGKPRDLQEAREILGRLSGQVHEVCSAVFVAHLARRKSAIFHELSRVEFDRLEEKTINRYLAEMSPLDKAGAYGAQGDGARIIRQIRGSFTNVVGLPMEKTTAVLAQFGIRPRPGYFRTTGFSRQQISSLLPSGSSKKKA